MKARSDDTDRRARSVRDESSLMPDRSSSSPNSRWARVLSPLMHWSSETAIRPSVSFRNGGECKKRDARDSANAIDRSPSPSLLLPSSATISQTDHWKSSSSPLAWTSLYPATGLPSQRRGAAIKGRAGRARTERRVSEIQTEVEPDTAYACREAEGREAREVLGDGRRKGKELGLLSNPCVSQSVRVIDRSRGTNEHFVGEHQILDAVVVLVRRGLVSGRASAKGISWTY